MNTLAFPLNGSRLIEAGAGTGKTYTIAQLYTRLVLGHGEHGTGFGRPLHTREILVVTFAEAAKLELRDRIRRRLTEAATVFRADALRSGDDARPEPPVSSDPTLLELRDSYQPEERLRAARTLEIASESMDDAAIYTIHGWCLRTLRRYSFETGIPVAEMEQSGEDAEAKELFSEAVRDYWRSTFYSISSAAAQELTACFSDPAALEKAIKPLLGVHPGEPRLRNRRRNAPNDIESVLERAARERAQCRDLNAIARRIWIDDRNALHQYMWQDLRRGMHGGTFRNCMNDDVFQGWLDQIDRWADGSDKPDDPPAIIEKLDPRVIRLKKETIPPAHPFFAALAEWLICREKRDPLTVGTDIMLHAALGVRRRFEAAKQHRGVVDFNDMLVQLDRALTRETNAGDPTSPAHQATPGELAQAIRQEFPVVLVDEFQDTDHVQYRVFDTVYGIRANNPDTGLFLIGDPKQAIYRFRGADIHTYLLARSATTGRHYALETNYRSTPALVHATNHLFSFAHRHSQGAFLFGAGEESAIPFFPAHPRPAADLEEHREKPILSLEGCEVPPVTVWVPPGGADTISTGAYRQLIAEQTGEKIARWLRRDQRSGFDSDDRFEPLKPADVAVLVRDHREASAVLHALRRRGVAGVYLSARDSVFDTPEAIDILRWFTACVNPEDIDAVRAALATAATGLPLQEIARSAGDDLLQDEHVHRFFSYNRRLRKDGVLPAIRALIQDYRVSARLLLRENGERSLTNLLHLAEWMHQTRASLENDHDVIRHLQDRIQDPGEEHVLRLESDSECVRVVTIFKAKGLEYNVVIAPFACMPARERLTRGAPTIPRPVSWYSDDCGRILEFDPYSAEAGDTREHLHRESLAEEMRLLYVTVTRAKFAVFLALAPIVRGNGKTPGVHTSGLGYLLSGGAEMEDGAAVLERLSNLAGGRDDISVVYLQEIEDENEPSVPDKPEHSAVPGERESFRPDDRRETPELFARTPARAPGEERWWIASYSAFRHEPDRDEDLDRFSPGHTPPPSPREFPPPSPRDYSRELPLPPPQNLPLEPELVSETVQEEEEDSGFTDRSSTAGASLHTFPAGPQPGTFLHELIERILRERVLSPGGNGQDHAVGKEEQNERIAHALRGRGWDHWTKTVIEWTDAFFSRRFSLPAPAAPVVIGELTYFQTEMEFLFESNHVRLDAVDRAVRRHILPGRERPRRIVAEMNGMFKGFIDLVFFHDGRYYLADWKSNRLGPGDQNYTMEELEEAMLHKRYDLQLAMYTLALHRHLSVRIPEYDYDEHVGCGLYFFLRGVNAPGHGLFIHRPDRSLLEELDAIFRGDSGSTASCREKAGSHA